MNLQDSMNAAALRFAISVLQEKLEEYGGGHAINRETTRPTIVPKSLGRPKGLKTRMSDDARRRIAEAQKRRWAIVHQSPVEAAPTLPEVPPPTELVAPPEISAEERAPETSPRRKKGGKGGDD